MDRIALSRWSLRPGGGATTMAAVLLVSALVAVGCGSSGKSASSSSSAPASTTASSSSSTPASTTASSSTASGQATISSGELRSLPRAPAATAPAPSPIPTATTVDRAFLETTFNDAQRFWAGEFRAAGRSYLPARLVMFVSSVHSACGVQGNVGPFYCPADRGIYLDLGFFDLFARQAGLGGFAQAYVVGHEFGHHVQHLLGVDRQVAAVNHANPSGENALSVRVELQADCLAGVWAHSVYSRGELTTSDLEEKLRAAALIGDDFQARAASRPVDPGLFTHGSSAQRQQWLRTGFESGDPAACDTFSAS